MSDDTDDVGPFPNYQKFTETLHRAAQGDEFYRLYLRAQESAEEYEEGAPDRSVEEALEAAEDFERRFSEPPELPTWEIGAIDEENVPSPLVEAPRHLTIFFSYSSLLLEEIMAELVYDEIVDDEVKNVDLMNHFKEELRYHDHRELLFRAEIIDEGLNGEVKKIREVRNKLIHDPQIRLLWFEDLEPTTEVDRAFRTVKKLIERSRSKESE